MAEFHGHVHIQLFFQKHHGEKVRSRHPRMSGCICHIERYHFWRNLSIARWIAASKTWVDGPRIEVWDRGFAWNTFCWTSWSMVSLWSFWTFLNKKDHVCWKNGHCIQYDLVAAWCGSQPSAGLTPRPLTPPDDEWQKGRMAWLLRLHLASSQWSLENFFPIWKSETQQQSL